MENNYFDYFKMFYPMKVVDIDYLKQVTKTEKNPDGYITPEEFKEICGEEFAE